MRQSLDTPARRLEKIPASGWFVSAAGRLWARWVAWWELRATVRTLRSLDTRALRDIGIDRYDIERVARSRCWPYDR